MVTREYLSDTWKLNENKVTTDKVDEASLPSRQADRHALVAGLENLCISGSGQFSKAGLKLLIEQIKGSETYQRNNCTNICIVDLREENHFLIGDHEYVHTRDSVKGESVEQLIDNQKKLINGTNFRLEGDVVRELGFEYALVPIKDNAIAQGNRAEPLINFFRTLKSHTWLHFHCRIGQGRTTAAMEIYDMLKNSMPGKWGSVVPLSAISIRHLLFGGYPLMILQSKDKDDGLYHYQKDYGLFLATAYIFLKEPKGFSSGISWTEWLKSNPRKGDLERKYRLMAGCSE